MKQKTINDKLEINGIGVHSGLTSKITLIPSKIDTGIIFRKINYSEDNSVDSTTILDAKYNNVVDTRLGTTISNSSDLTVLTIEHLMASLWACDIDNVIIEVYNNKNETPILDGSSIEFINKIRSVGTKELSEKRRFLTIQKKVIVKENDCFISIEPSSDFSIDMSVNFNYGNIGEQQHFFNGSKEEFINDIARCRTFCNKKDVEFMRANNLAKGGSLQNSMVFDENGIINEGGFRTKNEVVKHKILDCVGDMYTSGYFIKGAIKANKTGHTLNNKLLLKLFSDKNNYTIE